MGETGNWGALPLFSVLSFHGTGTHGDTQAIPVGEPGETYPLDSLSSQGSCSRPPCYNSQQLTDYVLFRVGEACFRTQEYHQSLCSWELFRHLLSRNNKYGRKVDGSALHQAFTAFTGSTRKYIHRALKISLLLVLVVV